MSFIRVLTCLALFIPVIVASIDLPPHLKQVGLTIFKSEKTLNNVLSSLTEPEVVSVVGVPIKLVQMKGDNSLQKIKDEFTSDIYEMKSISTKLGMIIDIGANIGAVSILAAILHPHLDIVAIEPTPTTYFTMRINMFLNNVKAKGSFNPNHFGGNSKKLRKVGRVVALLAAVSPDNSPGTIKVQYGDTLSQFAIVGSKKVLPGWKFYDVPKFNVNSVLDLGTSRYAVELLKIDCEGCEFWLLPDISPVFFDKSVIKRVNGEFHLSVMDANAPHAPDTVSAEVATRTMAVLRKRGCATDS